MMFTPIFLALYMQIGLPEIERDKAANLLWDRHIRVTMGPNPIRISRDEVEELGYTGSSWSDGQGNPMLAYEAYQILKDMGFKRDHRAMMHFDSRGKASTMQFDGGDMEMVWEDKKGAK